MINIYVIFYPPNRIVCFMNRGTATAHWGAVERKGFSLKIVEACLKETSANNRLAAIIRVELEPLKTRWIIVKKHRGTDGKVIRL